MMFFPDNGIDEMFAMENEKGLTAPAAEAPVEPTVPPAAPAETP
jgi:hypothetical protein